jgi:hypothetical protein
VQAWPPACRPSVAWQLWAPTVAALQPTKEEVFVPNSNNELKIVHYRVADALMFKPL